MGPQSDSIYSSKTWSQAAGLPETAARLEALPPGLDFPADFPEPIRYDAARRLLVYRGFMASASYQFLRGRSADLAYLAALDVLFRDSAYALSPRRRGCLVVWLCLLGAAWTGAVLALAP